MRINYDFREKGSIGFSGYTILGYLQDCINYSFYFTELEAKYRNYIYGSDSVFWSFQLADAIASAENWNVTLHGNTQKGIDCRRPTIFLPVGRLSLEYQFENKNYLSCTITYVPQNKNTGRNLLFT